MTTTEEALTRDELRLILATREGMEDAEEVTIAALITKRIPHISKELASWLTIEKCKKWIDKLNTQGVLFVPIIKKEKSKK